MVQTCWADIYQEERVVAAEARTLDHAKPKTPSSINYFLLPHKKTSRARLPPPGRSLQ